MWATIVSILADFLAPLLNWIRKKAFTIQPLVPIKGIVSLPEYAYPKGHPKNRVKISETIDFDLQWCCEMKEGDETHNKLSFSLPKGSLNLQIVGWGCLGSTGKDRYYGSIHDVGQIGCLRVNQKDGKRRIDIPVVLPGDRRRNVLRLADANPIFSGAPTNDEVRNAGLIGRFEFPYQSSGNMYWRSANIWASEIDIPSWASSAEIWPTQGSMHLIHIQVNKLVFPLRWLGPIFDSFGHLDVISTNKDPLAEIQQRCDEVDSIELQAEDVPTSPEQSIKRSSELTRAAIERMTMSYRPYTFDSLVHVRKAVHDFLQSGRLLGQNRVRDASPLYAYAFQAALQLGRDKILIEIYPELMNHFAAALNDAIALRDDFESLRCRWHIGWISLHVARLAKLMLETGDDTSLRDLRINASRRCFEIYHDQIAQPALQSNDLQHLWVAKARLDILISNATDLALSENQIIQAEGTRAQLREVIERFAAMS